MANEYLLKMGLGIGADAFAEASYGNGYGLRFKLERPASLPSLKALLESYEVDTSKLPPFVAKLLSAPVTIHYMEYLPDEVAQVTGGKITKTDAKVGDELRDAKVVPASNKSSLFTHELVGKDGKPLAGYMVRSETGADGKESHYIDKKVYTFVASASFADAGMPDGLEVLKGVITLKYVSFGITSNEKFFGKQLEEKMRPLFNHAEKQKLKLLAEEAADQDAAASADVVSINRASDAAPADGAAVDDDDDDEDEDSADAS